MHEVVGAFLERIEERKQEISAYVTMLGDGNKLGPTRASGEVVDPLMGWCLAYPANFSGHPVSSLPAGFTRGGPPVGMRLVGRRFDEATVLAASAAFERTRPWYGSYPPRPKHTSGTGSQKNRKRGCNA